MKRLISSLGLATTLLLGIATSQSAFAQACSNADGTTGNGTPWPTHQYSQTCGAAVYGTDMEGGLTYGGFPDVYNRFKGSVLPIFYLFVNSAAYTSAPIPAIKDNNPLPDGALGDVPRAPYTFLPLGYGLVLQQTSYSPITYNYTIPNVTAHEAGHWVDYVYGSAPNATRAVLSGTPRAGDVLSITVFNSTLSGGKAVESYTVSSTDTLASAASGLGSVISGDTRLAPITITKSVLGAVLYISGQATPNTTYSGSVSTGGTEVLTLTTGVLPSDNEATLISGTRRTGDIITITVHDSGLTGGTEPVAHTVTAADTFATIAQAFVTAINGDTKLQAIKVTASIYASSGTEANFLIKSQSPSAVHTTYTSSISSGGTETVAFRQTYYASDSVSFNHALTQDWVNINALSACGGTSHPGTGMFSNRKDYKGNYFCGGSSGFGPSLSTTAPNSTTPYSNTTAYPNNQAILSDPTNSYGSIFGSGNHEIFAEEFASQTYGDGVLSEGPNRGNTNPQSFDVYLGTNGLFSCTLAIVTIMASNGVPQGPGGNCPLN